MAKNSRLPGVGKISSLSTAGEAFNLDPSDRRYGDPVRACEICGEEQASSDMINFICVLGSPGHYTLDPIQHPDVEHWACSFDHWAQLAHSIVDVMRAYVSEMHNAIEGSRHRKVEETNGPTAS